jgi:DNA-dependent RNA polymerase auxiliary subunit epsilon
MSDTNTKTLKIVQELKAENKILLAQNKAILEALGIKQFLQPSEDEAKAKAQARAKADAKAKADAEPPTMRELYKKAKASIKRRGKTQAFYLELRKFSDGARLQGEDYYQEYVDCFNVMGYGTV